MTIPRTLALNDAVRAWDAVVIGAGPAGAVAAREMSRRGARVLLVDRSHFPRSKVCGGCLNGNALAMLARLGLRDLPVKQGAVPLTRFVLATGGRTAVVPLSQSMSLSRTALDAALIQEAIRSGVEFLPGTSATLGEATALSRAVVLSEGLKSVATAVRVVILASGLHARASELRVSPTARIGAGVTLEGVPAIVDGIAMAVARGGYVGIVQVENGRQNIAAAFDPGFVRDAGSLGRAACRVLASAGLPGIPQLEGADWKGTPALTRQPRRIAGQRWFAVGDAAGYVEPFTGEGMAWAIAGAAALAPIACRTWSNGSIAEWTTTHARLIAKRHLMCRMVAGMLRSPALSRWLVRGLAHAPKLAAPFVRRIRPPIPIALKDAAMSFVIRGLGTAVPPMTIDQDESLQVAHILCGPSLTDTDWLESLYRNSGVQTRHQVLGRELVDDLLAGTRHSGSPFLPGNPRGPTTEQRMKIYAKEAPRLAIRAAAAALSDAKIEAHEVTHIVTVSCTGFIAPGVDVAILRELALSPKVERVHVGFMGCHGAVNGLRVASALTAADPEAVVLLVAVELCSLHYYYGAEPGKLVANGLFADGTAAIVGTARGDGWSVRATGSCLIPDSLREMGWVIGDHGFTMTLTKQIPLLITAHLRPWLERWLSEWRYPMNAVGGWAVHPGGPKILAAVEEALALPPAALDVSREVLANYGNMSSATVLFILDRMRKQKLASPVVMLGFGPGLIAEAVLADSEQLEPELQHSH